MEQINKQKLEKIKKLFEEFPLTESEETDENLLVETKPKKTLLKANEQVDR